MDQPANTALPSHDSSIRGQHKALWIWSLLLGVAVFLFQNVRPTFRIEAAPAFPVPGNPRILNTPMGNFTSMFHVDWVSSLARRVALLVSVLYLLRFLRHHLLPAPSGSAPSPAPPRQAPASTTPAAVSYTLTGEPVIEAGDEEPMPVTSLVTVGATNGGPRLLWIALAAIVVALAIEAAADAWALLVTIGL